MAASAATASSSPGLCPSYAVICSFLERYGALLDLPELTFPQLERYLQDTSSVPKLLVDLHVKLLRKIGKSVSADRWEKHLVKLCQEFNTTWAWELEKKGYKEMTVECKTGILKYLCECQFDENVKFKTTINEEDPDKMRLQPIGRDKDGQMYWFQLDQDDNVRVYVEEQDDLDGSSWKCIVRDRNDLAEILALLKTQIDPALLKKEQEQESSPKPEDEENKKKAEEGGVKKTELTTDEEDSDSKDTPCSVSAKRKGNEDQKDNLKSDTIEAKSPLNGVKDGKVESQASLQSEKLLVDDGVITIVQTIKEEPMEVSDTKSSTTTSEPAPISEKSCVSLKAEHGQEAKRNTAEELQRAMKNDQQAKIPLKKRGMKLSEDKSSGGNIIVQNPSVSRVKEAPKVDEMSAETKKEQCVNDHVNGDAQHATDKVSHSPVCEANEQTKMQRNSDDGKEQPTKIISVENKAADARGKEMPPTDEDHIKDKKEGASNTEKSVEVVMSQADLEKKILDVMVEKESTTIPDGREAAVQLQKSPSPLITESPPLSKDVNDAVVKTSDHEEHGKTNKFKTIDTKEAHTVDKTSTLKETNKSTSDESENLDSNHEVVSKEVKSDDSEKSEQEMTTKDIDTTESNKTGKLNMSEITENVADPKHTETINAKEIGTPEPVAEKPGCSILQETPGVIKKTETPSSDRDPAEKADDSGKIVSPSVIKKAEILKHSNDTERLDTPEDTQNSSVIKKADKPSVHELSEKTPNTKETVEASVIKKAEKLESCKPTETRDCLKGTEVSPTVVEKTVATDVASETVNTEEKEKPVFREDQEKTVNCEDNKVKDVAKMSNCTPKAVEAQVVAVKDDQTKPQEDDKIKMKMAAHKKSEEASEKKDKPSSPVEKKSVPEETAKKTERPEMEHKQVSKPNKNYPECPSTPLPSKQSEKDKESEKDTNKDSEKDTNKDSEKDSNKNSEKDSNKDIEKDSNKISEKDSNKASEKDSNKASEKDTNKDSEKDTNKDSEKDTNKESLKNESEKPQCQDNESKGDITTDEHSKTDEAKEDKHAHKDAETETEKLGHLKVREGPDGDEPMDEESKGKSEEVDSAKKEKEASGANAPSEVQEDGVRLKTKAPSLRRKAELQREERQGDSESDTNTGRSLRRSPRISRPTPKAVEIQDRRLEKLQAAPPVEKCEENEGEKEGEDEEEEEEQVKAVQKKPREKKVDQEGQPKSKGRKRRKIRWSSTRTRRKKKGSEDDDDNSEDESSDEESEDEDDSDEDYKVERNRKRRNRNRERRSSDSSTSSDDDLPPNDDPCKHCGLPNHPELILLCDSCDSGYHTACLRPPLMIIPDGEWFCPPCQHKQLCDKLEEQLQNLDASLKKKERAERRKERLVYVGISVENIIAPSVEEEKEVPVIKEKKEVKRSRSWGRRSTRTKKNISYRFDEFDEAIEEAIEEDIKEAEGGGAGRGKDMANITGLRGKDMSTILEGDEGKENGRPPRPSAGQRRKKRRRLNDLDSDSTVDEEESEDEFRLSDSSEEEEFVVSGNDAESESEAESNGSDFGSSGRHRNSSRTKRPPKRRRSSRRRRRPRGYSDDEEEETDEEDDEDELVTEGSSEFSDSDLDMSRRRSRRSQKKQVNYHETSESEGSQAETNRDKVKPRRRLDSSDSEASFSKDSEEESRDRRVKRRTDSSEEDSRQRRRRLALKRRRASEEDDDDDDDDDSDESEEEDRPIRKRVNRIDSDDDDEEEEKEKEKKGAAEKGEEEGGAPAKGTNPLDYNLVELPPTNGQSPTKSLEGLIGRPGAGASGLITNLDPPKNISATPAAAVAPNGLGAQEMAPQDEDEDDLLGVTDLVDYVCNNEQL